MEKTVNLEEELVRLIEAKKNAEYEINVMQVKLKNEVNSQIGWKKWQNLVH